MSKLNLVAFLGLSMGLIAQGAIAQEVNPRMKYNEPTRGFFIEHGVVNAVGQASIELHSGSDAVESGGGIRLGLPRAELIINSGSGGYDEDELLVKWAMPAIKTSEQSQSGIQWAITGGVGHLNVDDDDNNNNDFEQTNIKFGLAATVEADAGIFTLAPEFVIADGDAVDDNFVNVGLGGYVGLVDTRAGLFSIGAEALFTTMDDTDDTFSLGTRWAYNKHLTIDVIPFVFSDSDLWGVPGLVRLNATF